MMDIKDSFTMILLFLLFQWFFIFSNNSFFFYVTVYLPNITIHQFKQWEKKSKSQSKCIWNGEKKGLIIQNWFWPFFVGSYISQIHFEEHTLVILKEEKNNNNYKATLLFIHLTPTLASHIITQSSVAWPNMWAFSSKYSSLFLEEKWTLLVEIWKTGYSYNFLDDHFLFLFELITVFTSKYSYAMLWDEIKIFIMCEALAHSNNVSTFSSREIWEEVPIIFHGFLPE